MGFLDRLSHAWNVFVGNDNYQYSNRYPNIGYSSSYRPDRVTFSRGNEKSIVTAVYNRMAIDLSGVMFKHVRLDKNGRFKETVNSDLNKCLQIESNKDQQSRAFFQDVAMSLFDEGVVAIVPIDTTVDIAKSSSIDIQSMRTGKILDWYPDHIKVNVYNDRTGKREDIIVPKNKTAIIENPFYSVMNEKNSVLQRLITKMNLLDVVDQQVGSGKLDLIIQLPYVVKTDARRAQAEKRRADITDQLAGSKYGIAYTDGTEKVTQLNRPVENNLMSGIEYLTSMLFSQLGLTTSILDGTANEATMTNYNNRTIEPIAAAINYEMERKFLTKTARTQGQAIRYFSDPFKLVPIANLADIADKFTRNEILTSNEVRQIIGMPPVDNPKADELRNKNMPDGNGGTPASTEDEVNGVNNEANVNSFVLVFVADDGNTYEQEYNATSEEEAKQLMLADNKDVKEENIQSIKLLS